MLEIMVMYALAGGVAGILAGLLGIGGGLVIVPMLVFCLGLQGLDSPQIMQIALATSMASIMFTAVSSFMAHHRRGAVAWDIVRRIVPGILVGTLAGSFLASSVPSDWLKGFFVLFLLYVSTQMFKPARITSSRPLPGRAGMFGAGGTIGVFSALVGIGGGTLSVPFMAWHGVELHRAIGTSAAIGFPIAIAGSIGYVYNGLGVGGLPAGSLGFVYLPALAGIVLVSVLTAPLGVRLAHKLPVARLRRVFAVLLLVVALKMFVSLL